MSFLLQFMEEKDLEVAASSCTTCFPTCETLNHNSYLFSPHFERRVLAALAGAMVVITLMDEMIKLVVIGSAEDKGQRWFFLHAAANAFICVYGAKEPFTRQLPLLNSVLSGPLLVGTCQT